MTHHFTTGARQRITRAITGTAIGLALALTGVEVPATTFRTAGAGTPWLPNKVAADIPCANSPFGQFAQLDSNVEPVFLMVTPNARVLDEYSAEPAPTRVYRADAMQAGVNNTPRATVKADLNGDNKDEVVVAMGNGSLIEVAGYDRTGGASPTLNMATIWRYHEAHDPASISMVSADIDGLGKDELAVSWRISGGANDGKTRVVMLSGSANTNPLGGNIAQLDDAPLAYWLSADTPNPARLAKGDFLLDGREQVALVGTKPWPGGSNWLFTVDLIEYLTPWSGVLPTPPGAFAVGAKHFENAFANQPSVPLQSWNWFDDTDAGTFGTPDFTSAINGVDGLDADGGDLTDSAAAELVVHAEFHASNTLFNPPLNRQAIGQRLFRFRTARGTGNAIADLTLAYDYSRLIEDTTGNLVSSQRVGFAATIGNIDGAGKGEVLLLRDGEFQANPAPNLRWDAWSAASVEVSPGTYRFRLRASPLLSGSDDLNVSPFEPDPDIAVGDVDGDGIPEVVTVADSVGVVRRAVWRPGAAPGQVTQQVADESAGGSTPGLLRIAIADTDGDSLQAVLSTSNCRSVSDQQLRTLVWQPPYFSALQGSALRQARFGKSSSSSTATEERSGSYTSHDVSGYIGAGVDVRAFGVVFAATVQATFGHSWQANRGELHGTETVVEINQGRTLDSGEGLLITEGSGSNCYAYDVYKQGSLLPDSSLRACEVIDGTRESTGGDASVWNSLTDQVPPVAVPIHWVPAQRDWANLALFRPVTGSAGVPNASNATDGKFTTSANSTGLESAPYLEIDLGQVREIGAVRVFPSRNSGALDATHPLAFDKQDHDLVKYRLYASQTPFAGAGVPSGAGVSVFKQADNPADESVKDVWNVWTRDRNNPAQPLRARYLRFQRADTWVINVSEIQVFAADTHAEPPAFPDDVCDPVVGDGLFQGRVWDRSGNQFKTIELRGDLLWSGTNGSDGSTTVPGCSNDQTDGDGGKVRVSPIWQNSSIGAASSAYWDLSESSNTTLGSYSSIDSATRLGVQFDFTAGFGVVATAGAGYEFTTGVTQDVQTSLSWGSGLAVGGSMEGFTNPAPGVVNACRYFPRPYAYHLTDYSSLGFRHDLYVTDYVVRHDGVNVSPQVWQRDNVPTACGVYDRIFANDFE